MAERKPISKKLRFDVFKRDGFVCQYCGAHPPEAVLEVDHIDPVARGGSNSIDNLVTACFRCNRGKAAVPLSVVPKSLAQKAAEAAEREEQLRGYQAVIQAAEDRIEEESWRVADALTGRPTTEYGSDRLTTIRLFIRRLGVFEVIEAAEIMRARKGSDGPTAFRYFCGICWNKIRALDEAGDA